MRYDTLEPRFGDCLVPHPAAVGANSPEPEALPTSGSGSDGPVLEMLGQLLGERMLEGARAAGDVS
jgi:hypothetical protein